LADGGNADKKAYPDVLDEALKVTHPVEIRGVLLSLTVAARDTTASLLSKFWFVLAREPRIWESL
jgi:cytochrome P450